MEWQNVYLFISSTFNDMHAERDYLVKKVFPELRIWCSRRRLKLLDIDLRWGVSEADAQENKRVVEVCMQNIDKCRPFFLCFMGQRRGWVPGTGDVNEETLRTYPGLAAFIGKNSITELEVIHALEHPLDEQSMSVRHASFFFRDPSYLEDIGDKEVRSLFAPEAQSETKGAGKGLFHRLFRKTECNTPSALENFKEHISEEYQAVVYQADWNEKAISPELKNMGGKDLSHGRLEHFRIGNRTLQEVVLEELKQAICEEFPEHMEAAEPASELEREQNAQAEVLFQSCEAYIERKAEEDKIRQYLEGEEKFPYVLCAEAGKGKTSLLAHMIQTYEGEGELFYRFAGTTGESVDMERTFELLAQEMHARGLLTEKDVQEAAGDYAGHLLELCGKAAGKKKLLLILDSIDQWARVDQHLTWLSGSLPDNVKLVLSLRKGFSEELEGRLQAFEIPLKDLPGMTDAADKRAMIRYYLAQFLKNVDEQQLEKIIELPGSSNPLYLKIVLNELRMFGSFEQLWEQLNTDYGDTPQKAFAQILVRLEQETYGEHIAPKKLTEVVLAMMGCAQEAFRIADFVPVFRQEGVTEPTDEEILDDIQALLHHLDAYLVVDGEKADFRYDSFRRAAKLRYAFILKKRKWNGYLAEIYGGRCLEGEHGEKEPGLRKNLVLLGYHALLAAADVQRKYFQNARYLYYLLREAGPALTAEYLEKGGKWGAAGSHMGKIAELIRRNSAELSVNAGYLFYLLSQEREENPVTDQLLKEAPSLNCRYLAPAERQPMAKSGEFVPYRETVFPGDGIRRQVYVAGDYLVYVLGNSWEAHEQGAKDSVVLKRLEDEQEVFRFYTPGIIRTSRADRNYLYLWYLVRTEGREDQDFLEVFALPQCNSVRKTRGIAREIWDYFGNNWQVFGYAGVWYALAEARGKGFRVYLPSEGALLYERTFAPEEQRFNEEGEPSLMRYEAEGRFASEHFYEGSVTVIWDLLARKKIAEFEDQTVSFCADERELFIFHRTRERKQLVRRYRIDEKKTVLVEEKELPSRVGASDAVIGEEYLLTFGFMHDVTILSRSDLQVLGACPRGLGGSPRLTCVALQGRDILYITKEKIRRFRKQDLIGRFETEEGVGSFSLDTQVLEYRGKVYFMGSPAVMLDVVSHARTKFPCDSIYQYKQSGAEGTTAFDRIGEKDYVAGYASLGRTEAEEKNGQTTYMAVLQELPGMNIGMALSFELPAECRIEGIGFHYLSVMVVTEQTCQENFYEGAVWLPNPTATNPDQTKLFSRLVVYCYTVAIGERTLVKKRQIELLGHWCFVSFPDMEPWLVADGLYIDERTRALRIYRMTGELAWEREYPNTVGAYGPVVPAEGSCIYYLQHLSDEQQETQWQNLLLEIDLKSMECSSYPVGYDSQYAMKIVGYNEKEVILSPGTQFFCIFDREQKKITRSIPMDCGERLYRVVHKQDCYLCHFLHTSIWRVYSDEGDYLFSQLMPEDMDYYNDTCLRGDLCIVERESFRKKAPVFYHIADIGEL